MKVCKKNGKQKYCWRKPTAVQSMKRQIRKAERMWQKTKFEIHYSIYKDSLHAFNVEQATARQTFFSNLINSNLNNTHIIFASEIVKCSATANALSLLPFLKKINTIRKEIGIYSSYAEVTQIRPQFNRNLTAN